MAASQFNALHEFLDRQVLGQPEFTRSVLLLCCFAR